MVLGLDGVVVFTHPKTMVSKKTKNVKKNNGVNKNPMFINVSFGVEYLTIQ